MRSSTAPAPRPAPSQLSPQVLARSCGFEPIRSMSGASEARLAVSHFVRTDATPFRPRWEPDPTMHMLGVQITPQWMASRVNGRQIWRGTVPAMGVGLNRAGDSGEAEVRGPLSRLMYFLPERLVRRCAEQAGLGSRPGSVELINPCYQLDAELASLGRQTLRAMEEESELSPLRLDALGQLLVARLLERWSSHGPLPHRFPRGAALRGIARAEELLRTRFADRLGIAELAHAAGLSDAHFCRAFRIASGRSPHQFQLGLRLDKAKALLGDRALSVGEVAAAVGFDDPSHLARLFRRELGVSPTGFRRRA